MPMAIERGLARRGVLRAAASVALGLPLSAVCAAAPSAAAPSRQRASAPETPALAACWDDAQGRHWAGVLNSQAGGAWRVAQAVELPTRGHGLLCQPDGSLWVAARRPGDWLLHLSAKGRPRWHWVEAGRALCGHVTLTPDGRTLLSTEIDLDSGMGVLGLRDAVGGDKHAEYATGGRDPHCVLALAPDDTLWVANGGIDTATETGRSKRNLAQMDASIACLNAHTGAMLGQWRVPDGRLSLRHLAWARTAAAQWVLGVALQAEHDDPGTRAAAPLLATLTGWPRADASLSLAQGQPALAGYGGDVSVLQWRGAPHFAVSATRGHQVALYDLQGRYATAMLWAQAGALAANDGRLWAGGRDGWLAVADDQADPRAPVAEQGRASPTDVRLDNHALAWVRA